MSLKTPLKIRKFQRKLYTKAKQEPSYRFYRGGDLRGLCENSVGKPDAGNRHVRFDERGRETGRTGAAPFLDSTLPQAQETKTLAEHGLRWGRRSVYVVCQRTCGADDRSMSLPTYLHNRVRVHT